MNYSEFYRLAEKMLIDSIVSFWFKGKSKERDYMKYILKEKEPLLSEPVFQTIFPWESSDETFEEHATKLNIFTKSFVNALSDESIDSGLRFPLNRHPYKHQTKSWKTMLSNKKKTIVVTSGTGSGKTECFMVPVLQDLVQRNEKDAVQAIFLYPLNALMKSQQERIHAWCNSLPDKVTYAIYNGNTDKNRKTASKTDKYYPELVTRPQIRETPPQILFTNPTMLNYMLVRAEDKPILEKSKGKLKWILLDEAHTYTGSAAAELALQLRRVLDAFGVTIDQVNFAVTSATMGDDNAENKLKTFVSQLTGKDKDDIVVIGGNRIIPEMNTSEANSAINKINEQFNSNITLAKIKNLRKKLNSSTVLSAKEIAKYLDINISKTIIDSLKLIDCLSSKVKNLDKENGISAALLPTRAHYFIRSIAGVYACVNQECSKDKSKRIDLGSLTTFQSTNCDKCKSQLLEVALCPSCGGLMVVGESSTQNGYRMRKNIIELDEELFYNNEVQDVEDNKDESPKVKNTDKSYTSFYLAKPKNKCLRNYVQEDKFVFNHSGNKIELAAEDELSINIYKSLRHQKNNSNLCPHCGNSIKHLTYLRISANHMGRILATLVLDNAEKGDVNDIDVLYEGKRYISFSDNRQGSARLAMSLNQDVERSWIRASLFHKLADFRLDNVEPAGLTEEEEGLLEAYKEIQDNGTFLKAIQDEYNKLLKKKEGGKSNPESPQVLWDKISRSLENNSDCEKLFLHLDKAKQSKYKGNYTSYLKALFIDQFGWIPKRANSLETMGLVHLVYPNIKLAKCPGLLRRLNNKQNANEEWQNFLKICIDYVIRAGKHYMISGDDREYLTQNNYTRPIYPRNTNLRKDGKLVSRWPSVQEQKGKIIVNETQSRLVLLLCAALGYTDIEEFTTEHIANINSLLDDAWNFITDKILEVEDNKDKGYMLDLMGDKVKLKLYEKGYLCPVDNVIVDTTFYGYSPRISGYIGEANFVRFKVKDEFEFPFFPFKSDELDRKKINNWIDNNLQKQEEFGLITSIHRNIYNQKPIFIAAEHSAQQSREDLESYEKKFNKGYINILSCSTTMEMGVDIGGISEVVMNNVPPKSSNYLQRAGRAGRRGESKALALTFCAPNPVGVHTWKNPKYPIVHTTAIPFLKLESKQLIQRHVNALIFADFVSNNSDIKVTSNLKEFFGEDDYSEEYNECYKNFVAFIDGIISGKNTKCENAYDKLKTRTYFNTKSLSDVAYFTKKDIIRVYKIYHDRIISFDNVIEENCGVSGVRPAIEAIKRQRKNLEKTSLLSFLAEHSFLPSAGIPTGLVECELKHDKNQITQNPTMHLSQAISSYAPDNQVVKNEWVYKPSGIKLKTKYDKSTTRYMLQQCPKCDFTTIRYGKLVDNKCPKCGEKMFGLKEFSNQLGTEVIEPAAFTVQFGSKPTRKINKNSSLNFIQPVLLNMDSWPKRKQNVKAKMFVRTSTSESEILFYNKGTAGYGYEFCPYCGKMKSESNLEKDKPKLAKHTHLLTNKECQGSTADGDKIRRHVLLVGRYQTNFVEIRFYDSKNSLVKDSSTLYTLGVILSRKLTELLGVNDNEIDFGYNSFQHSIFIYDTALGGAGYSTLFREYKDEVLRKALEALEKCNCDQACTKCLIDRRSQWYLDYLDRKKALEWLQMEVKSREAPSEISEKFSDVSFVTTDFTTELSGLTLNNDVKSIKFFIDNDCKKWETTDFRYFKFIDSLINENTDVTFVLNNKIDIQKYEAEEQAMIIKIISQYHFEYYETEFLNGLIPLLYIEYSDGKKKIFFGEKDDVCSHFNIKWGDGNIYYMNFDLKVELKKINEEDILSNIRADDATIMFESRLKKNIYVNNILQSLIDKNTKWDAIGRSLRNQCVDVTYSDRYLKTPLGCLILANLLENIKTRYNLTFNSLNISVALIRDNNYYGSNEEEIKIIDDFTSNNMRNEFLESIISKVINVKPQIIDNDYVKHERFLTIKNDSINLCIRPDGGVSHGWKPFGYNNSNYTNIDLLDNSINLLMYNQNKVDGILYTIAFNKLK